MKMFSSQYFNLVAVPAIIGIYLVPFVITVPQIFTDTYTFCEFIFDTGKLTFPNKVWTIETKEFTLHYSLCESVHSKCRNQTASCLIRKAENQLVDLGHEFGTADYDNSILVSRNGAKCPNSEKNHTLVISFQCSNSARLQPRLMPSDDEDECGFEVSMLRPDCRPKCTETIQGAYTIDMRSFRTNIPVESELKKFSLTLCGPNPDCKSPQISGCEIVKNESVPLMQTDSQHLVYDVTKNELTARGRFKRGRLVREVQVLIKCNWQVEMANPRYKEVRTQGKRYRFEIESSYGCVKLPQNCALSSIDNLNYNLAALNRDEGWQVSGVPEGRITLNICGSLKQTEGICSDQHSQVCHLHSNNYTNRGSILASLKAQDDVIRAVFVSGSTCAANNSHVLHSTQIEFSCARVERGPVFKKYDKCVTLLTWETPKACPVDFYTGSNCYMSDRLANRNLRKLYTDTDKKYSLSADSKTELVFNLCGPIHTTCDNFTNVSFCLKTNQQKDVVVGWDTRNLISDSGSLRMELTGASCAHSQNRGEVIVNFICSYEDPSPPPHMNVLEDGCKFNMTIFTRLACLSQAPFRNCHLSSGDVFYDLSLLSHRDKNYVISNGDDLEYIFNVCGPIISGPGALCTGDTMFCVRNKTEVNIKRQFTSLGTVGGLRLVNNDTLVLHSTMGSYCKGFGHYKTVVNFECSQKRFLAIAPSTGPCTYNFIWKTPEACHHVKKCVINSTKPDTVLDLTYLQEKTVNINVDNGTNKYEFHLCDDYYTKNTEGIANTHPLKRQFFNNEKASYLIFNLEKNCDNSSKIDKVVFKLECSYKGDDSFEQTSFEKCVLNMTIRTQTACLSDKEKYLFYVVNGANASITESVTTIISERIEPMAVTPPAKEWKNGASAPTTESAKAIISQRVEPVTVKLPPEERKHCALTNRNTGYEFNLTKIQSGQLLSRENSFVVNLDGSLKNCNGVLCKNDARIVAAAFCPISIFNYTQQMVQLQYSTTTECSPHTDYELEIWLKCNQTKTNGQVLKDELCRSVILYNLPEACFLLKQDAISSVPVGAIAGSVTSILLVLVGLSVVTYVKRKQFRRSRYINIRGNKAEVPIYIRNFTE